MHHVRKPTGNEVTVEDGRGAIALLNAARSGRVINTMSEKEAIAAGLKQRRLYFRAEDGKTNMPPPPEAGGWFKLVSVPLGNADSPIMDNGDQVAVVTKWEWPNLAPT